MFKYLSFYGRAFRKALNGSFSLANAWSGLWGPILLYFVYKWRGQPLMLPAKLDGDALELGLMFLGATWLGVLVVRFALAIPLLYFELEGKFPIIADHVPLYEAARLAYESIISSGGAIAASMSDHEPDSIITWFGYALSPKLKIFGERPPSRMRELYSDKSFRNDFNFEIEEGHLVANARAGKARWVNLCVSRTELDSVIDTMRAGHG